MDGQDSRSPADGHVDFSAAKPFVAKAHGHLPAGAFVVPDPNLIFNGEFKRAGLDLVLSHDGHEFVVHDYFRGDKRAAIASPDGAHLTGDLVSALTGHVQYAQAAPGTAAAQVIGHVTKLSGSATAIRNGVSVILNNGDNVEKGDVVSTGSDSTLGITFIDGTVFGLSSNARMVLNEMVYDPNGSNNSSLLSLVAGTITFVAGETAKHGDMKVDTPVATMGIRGTAVLTQINFVVPAGGGDPQPQASFQVLVEPNGTTGSYILFDKVTLLPIATVNQAGQMIQISGGNVSVTNALMSPEVQKLITDVFTLKFTDNSTNTKLTTNYTDTITPFGLEVLLKSASGTAVTATFVNLNPQTQEKPTTSTPTVGRIPGQPIAQSLDLGGNVKTAFALTERADTTGDTHADTISGLIRFLDQNLGDLPTVSVSLAEAPNYVYKNAGQQDVTGSLTALQKQDIAATQIQISVVADPDNNNNGSAVWTYTIPDHVFDFLAAGETLTLTYMVRVDTNFSVNPESKFIPITITITGTNDKPVITTDVPVITFEGGTSVPGGPLTSDVPTSGTLSFDDVDLTDEHTVSVALTSATLPGGTVPPGPLAAFQSAMSVAIAAGADSTGDGTGTINWSLADLPVYLADFIPKGAVLTLVYTVTVTDSQGATAQQTITVTITGTDAPAVVWIATDKAGAPSGGFWKDAANWETGTVPTIDDDVIVITDQLHGLTPSYPVTIDAAAYAKSLTMNDFGGPPPKLINQSSLTIAGALNMSADSILTNAAAGTMSVGGKAEISGTSVLTNAGHLTLEGGGDFAAGTTITNSGTINLSGGTLTLDTGIANAAGTVQVGSFASLVANAATIDGGTVNVSGRLELDGITVIENGTLINSGLVNVKGAVEFASETGFNKAGSLVEVFANGALTIDHGSHINNGGDVKIDASGKLTVNGATIDGGGIGILPTVMIYPESETSGDSVFTLVGLPQPGTVTNNGELDLTGNGVLSGGNLTNNGTLNVTGTGNALDNETVTNSATGTIEVLANGALTIDQGSVVTNTGNVTVDANGKLTVNGASINGAGTVTDNGEIDLTGNGVLSGSTLHNNATLKVSGAGNALHNEAVTNAGTIEVLANGALTIDQGSVVTNTGNITVDATGKLTVNGAGIDGAGILTDNGEIDLTGNAVLSGGILNNNATLKVSGTGNALENETVTNAGTIEVTAGGALAITQGATVDNSIGNVVVDANAALTLNDATITGGAIAGAGTIDVTGNAVIDGHAVLSTSAVTVEAGTTLTLDNVTVDGTTISDNGSLTLDGTVKLTGGAVIKGASSAFALQTSGSPVTARFDWGQLGTSYTVLGSPLQVVATNGTGGTVSSAGGIFELRDQGNGWYGNFEPGTHLLWDRGAGPDITVQFATPVYSAGAQIQANYFGGFTAEIIAYDLIGNVIGSVSKNGVSTGSADNSAIFIELTGSSAEIAKVKFHLTGVTYSPNDFAIGPVIFTETTGGGSGPIVNNGTLEISGPATLLNDVVTNHGTVMVDGGQTLTLSGTEISGGTIGGTGMIAVTGNSAIDGGATLNTSFVTIESGATLALDNVIVSGTSIVDSGILKVNLGKKLTLNGASVTGGQLNVLGTLASSGANTVTNASITNSGLIEAIGGVLTLAATTSAAIANAGTLRANGAELDIDHQFVTNTGTLAAINGGALKLTALTVTNTGGTVSVASGSTLDLAGATINGGTLTIAGTLESTGVSAVDGADLNNTGTITVTSGTLTIDPGLLHAITNLGLIEAAGGGILKLATATVSNAGGTIAVDGASKLYLTDVSINGGTLSNAGHLYGVSGSSTITGAVTNTGTIEVQAGTLNLAGGITGVGTLVVEDGATLELGGADAQTVTFAGGVDTLKLDATSHDFTGTITGQASTGGTFTVTGDGDINSSLGDAFDFTASGGTSGNRANIVLTPTGALTGAANGLVVTQNGAGDISLTATKDITGGAGNGITLRNSATGSGDITVNNLTGKATGSGANSVGVLVENLNAGNGGDISITQLGGAVGGAFGIDAGTLGNGDIDIDAGGSITGGSIYGIRTRSYGSGSQTVTTGAGSVVTSGSSGVVAVNRATSIDGAAENSITITAYGTIYSGSGPNLAGNAPAGIEAGYTGATTGTHANIGVNGTVIVNNHANITAAAGYGINAFSYGNGDVTVNSFAGTTISVSGAQSMGINAAALSGGTGDVTVTLGENVTISGAASYGIRAHSLDQGDISVTLANGDSITSGSSGIVAVNFATAIAAGSASTISVEAHGTIHSGTTLNNDGTTPGAIIAGYKPGGVGAFSEAVNGDVTVTSDATITADAGYGIEAFTWGVGDITVTTGQNSQISAAGTAIAAFDHGGGDVSITNSGSVTGAVGVAALATGAGDVTIVNHGDIGSTSLAGISVTQNAAGATGSTHITNSGSISAPTGHAAIYIQGNATGTVTIDNSGTIGPALASSVTSTTYAIVETGGAITINNSGDINGNISVATATFNNEAGGIWTVSGTSVFGNLSSIVNEGDIDLLNGASISGSGLSIANYHEIDSWGTATISGAITNAGTIEVNDGSLTLFGSLSGAGSVTVDAGALLKLEGTVTQTVTLAGDGAALQIDTSSFGGSIAGLSATDTIDLSTITYGLGTSAVYVANADPATGGVLTVTDADGNHIDLKLTGADYSNAHFAGSSDGHGGTLITFNADDDAPVFTAAEASPSVNFSELESTTGSSALDPVSGGTGTIHFKDIDLTDRPTVTNVAYALTWLDTDHTTQLTLSPDEITALEQALTLSATGNKNNGAIGWSYSIADSALDFLGEGQTVTVVSTITLADHQGKTDTAAVTVTITGKNDAPVITVASGDSSGADLDETNGGLDKTGTLTLSDADATDHVSVARDHVSVYLDGVLQTDDVGGLSNTDLVNYLSVQSGDILNGTATHAQFTWTFNSQGQAFDFLAAGQTLSLQYTIVPSDAGSAGASSTVTIDIAGSNDAPTLDDATLASISGNDGDPSGAAISSLFTDKFHDADTGATFKAVAVTSDAATAAQGVWQYELAGTDQWVDIGSVSDTTALVLGPDTLIRFVPANGFSGTPGALGVHALDDTYTGAITTDLSIATIDLSLTGTGGETPVSQDLTTIGTEVTAPADGPVINTESFQVEHIIENNSDIITDLMVTGSADHEFTVTMSTAHPGLSQVDFYPASGSLEEINLGFETGATYNPTGATSDPAAQPPDIEQITLTVTDQITGLSDTVNFIFNEAGDTGLGVTLEGTDGKDVIFATDTNSTLTGGQAKDQFVFAPGLLYDGNGQPVTDFSHTITDFTVGLDKIDLRQFSDVGCKSDLAIVQQQNGDTLITWNQEVSQQSGPVLEHESLLLKNVVAANLQASDFIFGTHVT
nr:VCBS domain-containing protein [Bradyrhizobium agreste]